MKLGRLNHVGVATPSLDRAIAFWRETMGAEVIREPFDLRARRAGVFCGDRPVETRGLCIIRT
jgi:methylmalonyl-CoA/ethylmalonyl-CoA epimerase